MRYAITLKFWLQFLLHSAFASLIPFGNAAQLTISPRLLDRELRLTWNSDSNQLFQLQGRATLDEITPWSTVTNVGAENGNSTTIALPHVLTQPSQFYHILEVSAPDLDPDLDGLNNETEFLFGTNPLKWDSDGDGLPDGWEVRFGLDPNSTSGSDGSGGDLDGDGIINTEEFARSEDPQIGVSGSLYILNFSVHRSRQP